MRLVLFDIDGTLLHTDGAGRRAVRGALLDELGTAGPIDGHRFDGKTDPQIVRELLTLAGFAEAEIARRMDGVFRRYLALLETELARPDQPTRILAGARDLLAALEPHEAAARALVGLLTGNLERGAHMKLKAAGLAPARFAVGAYGSDSGRRNDLAGVAVRRAAERTGRPFSGRDVVILGDTPEDVACGLGVGGRAVGVASGFHDVAALRAAGATHVFSDLSDTTAVLRAILG
jgi:phosphoglycolate phosphatase-like HAD superfamily hydrolase